MPKEIRIEVTVRNNFILTKMEERDIKSVKALCDCMGRPSLYATVLQLISMKLPARDKNQNWRPAALYLAEFFQCLPEDLFSDWQQQERVEKNRIHAEATYLELRQLTGRNSTVQTPEIALQAKNIRTALERAMKSLTPREARVLRLRFGFEGNEHTHDEIAEILNVTRVRIGQIEAKALRKLKHPSRTNMIVAATGSTEILSRTSLWSDSEERRTVISLDPQVLEAI